MKVQVICLHGDRSMPPTVILERDHSLDQLPLDRDINLASNDVNLVYAAIRSAAKSLSQASRGRWISQGGNRILTGRALIHAVTKAAEKDQEPYVQHQLVCDGCGNSERIRERELARALDFAARTESPMGHVVPLGGIKRYSELID